MAAVKSTFSLDEASIARLQTLARKWQVPKTEVLRRALQQTLEREQGAPVAEKLAALHALQKELHAQGVDFAAWKKNIQSGRR